MFKTKNRWNRLYMSKIIGKQIHSPELLTKFEKDALDTYNRLKKQLRFEKQRGVVRMFECDGKVRYQLEYL